MGTGAWLLVADDPPACHPSLAAEGPALPLVVEHELTPSAHGFLFGCQPQVGQHGECPESRVVLRYVVVSRLALPAIVFLGGEDRRGWRCQRNGCLGLLNVRVMLRSVQ